jgi:uncharacterized protein YwgA
VDEILEAEKLLLAVYEASRLKIALCREKINPYVYMMRIHYSIPLYYPFRFNPLPYSEELEDDLESLKNAGHICFSSPIEITEKGQERIRERMNEFSSLSNEIGKALTEMSRWDDRLLFQAIYNTITG